MAENILPDLKNEELVAAMNAIRQNENKDTQAAFLGAAVKAKYFTPVDIITADGTVLEGNGKMEIPKDAKFNFKLISNSKGEQYFPLFTDIQEFQKWNKSDRIKAIVVVFPQMADLVSKQPDKTNGFVINPMSQNLIFTKEILDSMLKNVQENLKMQAAAAGGNEKSEENKLTLYFGKPTNIPDSVVNTLSKNFAKYSEINKAYFLMMKKDEQEFYLFVLDMDADEEKSKKIADSLCASTRLFLSKFPVMFASKKSVYGQNADKVTEPFYVKA